MCQWTGSSLVQVMACRLFGAKPLPEPMLVYCHLDTWEQVSVKFESELSHFHSWKCIWKCCLPKERPFCPGGDGLRSLMLELWLLTCNDEIRVHLTCEAECWNCDFLKKRFQCIGYDNTAYVDYMDLIVRCSGKAVKFSHSLSHSQEMMK